MEKREKDNDFTEKPKNLTRVKNLGWVK